MTKPAKTIALEVLSAPSASSAVKSAVPLKERRDRILGYHSAFLNTFAQQAGYAYLAGVELNSAKADLGPRGGFIEWHKENLPHLSNGSVHNYMAFAERMQALFPTVGNITSERLQLTDGRLREKDQTLILEAVHAAADGSSLTQLYRELGVIKKPTARAAIDTSRKDLSPEQAARELEAHCLRILNDAVNALAPLRDDEIVRHLDLPDINRLLDDVIETGKFLRSIRSARKSKKGSARVSRAPAGVSPAPKKKGPR